jgi:hypothetical protein
LDDHDAPLPGHYEVDLWTGDGDEVRRFLTGQRSGSGVATDGWWRRQISEEEMHDLTVEPDLEALVARIMEHESGEVRSYPDAAALQRGGNQ